MGMKEKISQPENPENKIENESENKSEDETLESILRTAELDIGEDTLKEEKPQEEPVLEPTDEEEPAVPLEEITEEVKKQTKEEVKAEILKALGVTQEEKEIAEEQGYKTPWEKRGEEAPATWQEAIEAAAEFQEFKKQEAEKAFSEQQKHELALAKEREAEINTEWDSQLDYLREQGLIPEIAPEIAKKLSEGKVLSLKEREDPGLKAQVTLFEQMYSLAQERELQGKGPITDLIHIHSRYFKPTQKPSGANAPVSGGSIPVSKPDEDDIPYEKLHNARGFEELL